MTARVGPPALARLRAVGRAVGIPSLRSVHDTAINVAPLVDVGLVLLIVMIIALSYAAAQAIPMELPEREGAEAAAEPLRVVIRQDGSLTVDGDAVSALELAERARRFARSTREPHAVVAADPSAAHGAFVRAIDVLRTARVRRYTVAFARRLTALKRSGRCLGCRRWHGRR